MNKLSENVQEAVIGDMKYCSGKLEDSYNWKGILCSWIGRFGIGNN